MERVVRGWGWVSRVAHELDEVVVFWIFIDILLSDVIDFPLNAFKIQPIDFFQPYKISRVHNP